MNRKCKICGGTDKLVDIYHMPNIEFFGKKQETGKPDIYCNACFLVYVWYKNSPEKSQEPS